MPPPRVLIALEPRMHAETLAFSIGKHRPAAEVVLVDPEGLGAEALRLRPDLVVANRVPEAARGAFWVEVADPAAGRGPLGAEISADGHSRTVGDVRTEDVLGALDHAEGLPAGLPAS